MDCPICLVAHIKECSCILDKQNELIASNPTSLKKIKEIILELVTLNELLVESSTQTHDAKFYIGRRAGIQLIEKLITKIK